MKLNAVKIKVRTIDYQGKKFDAFKGVLNDGTLIDVKFTKNAKEKSKDGLPTSNCVMYIEPTKMNVSHKKEYPVLWIDEFQGFKPIGDVIAKQGEEEIKELFGSADDYKKDDLPF